MQPLIAILEVLKSMKYTKLIFLLAGAFLVGGLLSCTSSKKSAEQDEFLWLEDITGERALNWSKEQNKKSLEQLASDKQYKKMQSQALRILEAKDKIPKVWIMGDKVYNFWQGKGYVRGVLRRASYRSFVARKPRWSPVLNLDKLAKTEEENWVFKGMHCLSPAYSPCVVKLSRGGKDAVVVREFDLKKKQFVKNGFFLKEAKSELAFADKNHLIVGTDFGNDSMTDSGYPRILKLWKRGTDLSEAKEIFKIGKKDTYAFVSSEHHRGKTKIFISRAIDFFTNEEHVFDLKTATLQKIPKPAGAETIPYFLKTVYFSEHILYVLSKDWKFLGKKYNAGDLVSIRIDAAGRELTAKDVQLVFSPTKNQSLVDVSVLNSKLLLSVLEDVKGRVYFTELNGKSWRAPLVMPLQARGHIDLMSGADTKDYFLYTYKSFDKPSTLYTYDFRNNKNKLIKRLPAKFNAKNLVVKQEFSVSKDGTRIPYFIVHKKNIKLDGTNPTLLYGYGGFAVSLTPSYMSVTGKLFLERGGVFVLANIRGGGEYGPSWHTSAVKEKRQNAYDDFISVAERLIETKVTSSAHLAISGASNGGLLVGAVMVQRPDLFAAVICGVPLLDMLRYSKLLAGASWMSEYGNPDVSGDRAILEKYSPYQNVEKNKKYPQVFMFTSTKDDRVHPGHARKMTARMMKFGHEVIYYENIEGGHASSTNLSQKAQLSAMQYNFLQQTIFKK